MLWRLYPGTRALIVVLAVLYSGLSEDALEGQRGKAAATAGGGGRRETSLFADILSMLYVSYLVQDIALFNHWEANAAAAIRHEPLTDPQFFKTLPKTASQVLDWLEQNMEILKRQQSYTLRKFDPEFDQEGLKALVAATTSAASIDQQEEEATIEFYNDDFGFMGRNSKPVYGIIRNPVKKRIVLVFRGSVNPRDWEQDFNVQERQVTLSRQELKRYVTNPDLDLLQDFDHVHVHAGFHDYLFEAFHDDEDDKTMMEEITQQVLKQLNDPRNQGYTLYITGHSLGGALATNVACTFALSNSVPLPIKLITFASPSVGKEDFVKAFNELEKDGRIQHLRITNDDDIVPQGLSIFGHRHTGIHLNLGSETFSVGTTSKDEVNNISISHKWFLGNPSHQLQEHKARLANVDEQLTNLTFESLFEDPELQTWRRGEDSVSVDSNGTDEL